MECPKCRHRIYLDLTPEELVYCPYCDQRLIPPKEFNLCPVCGGELSLGSVSCMSCDKKMMSEEEPVIDQHQTQTPLRSRENIASLVNKESPAVQETEPRSMSNIEGTPPPVHEEPPAGYQAVEPLSNHNEADIPLQQLNEEPPVVGQTPLESRVMPDQEAIPPQFVEAEPVVVHPPDQTDLQANEDIALIVNGESPTAQKPPESRAMPVPEMTPLHSVEETPPSGDMQPQAPPAPSREVIPQSVNDQPLSITQETTESRTTLDMGDTPPNNEFGFCFACGQKLPFGSFYCPRCGKSMKVHTSPNAPIDALQPDSFRRHEDVVRPENEESPIMNKPPGSRAMSPSRGIPSNTNEASAPLPIQYVQPKYHPIPSRESISEAMDDRAPAMQPFPRAKVSPRAPLKPVWSKIRGWLAKAISSARDLFRRQWWLRRIYRTWVKESDITPEATPSTEALKQETKEAQALSYQPMRLVYLILGAIVFVVFFIFIGVSLSR